MLVGLILLSVALGLACAGLGGCCWLLWQRQQQQMAKQVERDALVDKRMQILLKRLETYQAGQVRMGEQVQGLAKVVAPLPDRLTQIEQSDPTSLSFSQAARLVGLGASADDLTQACGLSQAEAELVTRLHRQRQQRSG